jgi:hypothetical protein
MKTESQIAEQVTRILTGEERRRSGRTTRIIDDLVNDFFTLGVAICRDHHDSEAMHNYVTTMVLRRINAEHHAAFALDNVNHIVVNTAHPEGKKIYAEVMATIDNLSGKWIHKVQPKPFGV